MFQIVISLFNPSNAFCAYLTTLFIEINIIYLHGASELLLIYLRLYTRNTRTNRLKFIFQNTYSYALQPTFNSFTIWLGLYLRKLYTMGWCFWTNQSCWLACYLWHNHLHNIFKLFFKKADANCNKTLWSHFWTV